MTSAARAIAGLALVAGLAAADPILLQESARIEALHAVRLTLDDRLEVSETFSARTLAPLPTHGTAEMPAELTSANAPAATGAPAGNWTWSATVRERFDDAVPRGLFVVSLLIDGTPAGEVHVAQRVREPSVREGARVVFDVGRDPPQGALIVVLVREIHEDAVEHLLTSGIGASLDYEWRDEQGRANPTLDLAAGEAARFRVRNGEGSAPHNLRILDAAGAVVAGPTRDVENAGDETTLEWTPQAAGQYRYECRYHPTMSGTLEVN